MNLHQLNLSFDARQDRLLLKVSTQDAKEFRFWFTRRMVLLAWPHMLKVMQALPLTPQSKAPAAPLEFRHAAAMEQADFKTPYEVEGKTPALEAEPLLVSQFSLRATGADAYEMTLAATGSATVSLKLPATLLHGLVKLIQDSVKAADWNLSLALPAATMASAAIN